MPGSAWNRRADDPKHISKILSHSRIPMTSEDWPSLPKLSRHTASRTHMETLGRSPTSKVSEPIHPSPSENSYQASFRAELESRLQDPNRSKSRDGRVPTPYVHGYTKYPALNNGQGWLSRDWLADRGGTSQPFPRSDITSRRIPTKIAEDSILHDERDGSETGACLSKAESEAPIKRPESASTAETAGLGLLRSVVPLASSQGTSQMLSTTTGNETHEAKSHNESIASHPHLQVVKSGSLVEHKPSTHFAEFNGDPFQYLDPVYDIVLRPMSVEEWRTKLMTDYPKWVSAMTALSVKHRGKLLNLSHIAMSFENSQGKPWVGEWKRGSEKERNPARTIKWSMVWKARQYTRREGLVEMPTGIDETSRINQIGLSFERDLDTPWPNRWGGDGTAPAGSIEWRAKRWDDDFHATNLAASSLRVSTVSAMKGNSEDGEDRSRSEPLGRPPRKPKQKRSQRRAKGRSNRCPAEKTEMV